MLGRIYDSVVLLGGLGKKIDVVRHIFRMRREQAVLHALHGAVQSGLLLEPPKAFVATEVAFERLVLGLEFMMVEHRRQEEIRRQRLHAHGRFMGQIAHRVEVKVNFLDGAHAIERRIRCLRQYGVEQALGYSRIGNRGRGRDFDDYRIGSDGANPGVLEVHGLGVCGSICRQKGAYAQKKCFYSHSDGLNAVYNVHTPMVSGRNEAPVSPALSIRAVMAAPCGAAAILSGR